MISACWDTSVEQRARASARGGVKKQTHLGFVKRKLRETIKIDPA